MNKDILANLKAKPKVTYNNTKSQPTDQVFNVSQINNLYGYNQLPYKEVPNGPILNIAIVIAYSYPNLQNDLDQFCKINNIASSKLNIVQVNPNTTSNSDWATEICLDTQWVHAICPYANITVVECVSDAITDLVNGITTANKLNPKPDIVNMSWGTREFESCDTLDIFDKDILYIASSGDDNYVSWPSSNPNVVAISATTAITNSTSTILLGESTWSNSGCGPSQYFKIPNYQKNNVKTINSNYRLISDICIDGNPQTGVYIYSAGSYFGIGGTSLSAPLISGTMGIVTYQRKIKKLQLYNSNQNDQYGIQNLMYNIYGTNNENYKKLFYDVTQGSSGNYSAAIGYDYPTGLGTPYITNFVPYFVNYNSAKPSARVLPYFETNNKNKNPSLQVTVSSNSEALYKTKDNQTGSATCVISVSATSSDLTEKNILEQKLIEYLEKYAIPIYISSIIGNKIEKINYSNIYTTSDDII